jgi:hypothetical protein
MNLLFAIQKNRAAKRYARRLPGALRKGWGRSASYTPGQVQAAVKILRLDPRFIVFGYAAFLSEEAFAEIYANGPPLVSRESARETFHRFALFSSGPWNATFDGAGGGWSGDYYFGDIDHGSGGGGHGGHH